MTISLLNLWTKFLTKVTILRARDHEDSLQGWWRRTYAEWGSTLSEHYVDSIFHLQDSLLGNGIRLNTLMAAYDTTRRGTQVAHTYRLCTAAGQFVRDSAHFLVPRRGPVVQLPKLKPLY